MKGTFLGDGVTYHLHGVILWESCVVMRLFLSGGRHQELKSPDDWSGCVPPFCVLKLLCLLAIGIYPFFLREREGLKNDGEEKRREEPGRRLLWCVCVTDLLDGG